VCSQKPPQPAATRTKHDQVGENRLIVRNVADRCEPQQTAIVGSTGFELPQSSPGKTTIEEPGGAESGALPAGPGADPLLAMVVEAWPSLPAAQRLAVVEIIAAVGGRPGAAAHRRQ
jgi:hypothetical protein